MNNFGASGELSRNKVGLATFDDDFMLSTYRPTSVFLGSKTVDYDAGNVKWAQWHNFIISTKIDESSMMARVLFFLDGKLITEANVEQTQLYFSSGFAMTLGGVSPH